ncbi:MAG: glycosyltransferase family 2 protein [Hungatella sp.]|nr:glycosyltransferase family 2 protein [Hungatella sp.]
MKKEPGLKVDVLIPVYKPDKTFSRLLQMLKQQTYPINRIIVMNTEERYWDQAGFLPVEGLEVHHVTKEDFDHGGTRNLAAGYSQGEIMIFMTDDAVPRDRYLVERLVEALEQKGPAGETVAMAYGRQMPRKDCRTIERYTRNFNYPDCRAVKTLRDLPRLGIKTYFASNVCCAYRKEIFEDLHGFIYSTIFNEDMIYGAGVIKAGYAIAYEPGAMVIHSHNLTAVEQFCRNFDLAVSQADHPEVFEGLPSEGEGIRMVKQTAAWLMRTGRFWLLPSLVMVSGCKYLGYLTGKRYKSLPRQVILRCTMNRQYWERKWRQCT